MSTAIGTQIIMALNGVDNFSSVLSRAGGNVAAFARNASRCGTVAAQQLSLTNSAVHGLAAKGAVMAGIVSRVLSGAVDMAKEMGALSDRAQDAGTTTQMLQKMTAAMQNFGVRGASIDMVSRALQEMTKRTGKQGAQGFAEILGSIARVNDAQERASLLAEAFGKDAGRSFSTLVANGIDGLDAGLFELMGRFQTASDEAVFAGDAIADKWNEVQFGLKNGFMEAIGAIWSDFDDMLGGTQINLSKWVSTAIRWVGDAVRVVFKAVETVGAYWTSVVLSIAEPFRALFDAIRLSIDGNFALAGDRLKRIGENEINIWGGFFDTFGEIWDGSLFNLPDDVQSGMGDALKEAAKNAKADWRKAGTEAGRSISSSVASSRPQFAKALGFGTNEALKMMFGAGRGDTQREVLNETRRTNDILTGIGDGIASLGVC